jgi:hypothetical protein
VGSVKSVLNKGVRWAFGCFTLANLGFLDGAFEIQGEQLFPERVRPSRPTGKT